VAEGHVPLVFSRREVAVLMVGSLAFASLTNIDIVLASYYLDGDSAGVYAAAALVGKFVLLMPAAVVTVLLPKAASRAAAGATSEGILLLSVGVTLALTLIATVVLALVPESLLVRAFGPDFRESTALLGWFGLTMTVAALLNVYLQVYLAHKDFKFPMLLGVAAIAQVVVVAFWHSDPLDIVLATLACCAVTLAIHEAVFRYRITRLWAARARG
jgi:O-antigen/teichoic acid export membrane protein